MKAVIITVPLQHESGPFKKATRYVELDVEVTDEKLSDKDIGELAIELAKQCGDSFKIESEAPLDPIVRRAEEMDTLSKSTPIGEGHGLKLWKIRALSGRGKPSSAI